MMKIIAILLLAITMSYAGDPARTMRMDEDYKIMLVPQGMDIESYHAFGFSNSTKSDISSIANGNPAVLTQFNSLSIGLTYDYFTKMEGVLIDDISMERRTNWYPNKIGIAFPFKNFHLGLGYHQKYFGTLLFEGIHITTIENMDGIGTMDLKSESIISSYSGMLAYTFLNIFSPEDNLSIGFQLSLDRFYDGSNIATHDFTEDTDGMSWKTGANYHCNKTFNCGIVFEKGVDIQGKTNYPDDSNYPDDFYTYYPDHYVAQLPGKLAIGFSYTGLEKLSFSASVTQVFWNKLEEGFKNSLIYTASAQYQLPKQTEIFLGVYNANRYYKSSSMNDENNFTQLGLGVKKSFDDFLISLGLNDSHLFSSGGMKFTHINLGVAYSLF